MNEKTLKNVGASVRQRLLHLSREQHASFQDILDDYVRERFLYRLSRSQHKSKLILKGSMLFRLWSDEPHRATRDLDLLAFGNPAAAELGRLFGEICSVEVEDDGVEFHAESVRVEDIREEQEYGGVRIRLLAFVAGARVSLQIDVGFGDSVTPSAEEMAYPAILGFAAPIIRAYAQETMIAEKLHAMVVLGMVNSRMKDFYDIHSLATSYEFHGSVLCPAIRSTFERRTTVIPAVAPLALSPEFSQDRLKMTQWHAFVTGRNVRNDSLTLAEVIEAIGTFLLPPMSAMAQHREFDATWLPPGPWTS